MFLGGKPRIYDNFNVMEQMTTSPEQSVDRMHQRRSATVLTMPEKLGLCECIGGVGRGGQGQEPADGLAR